jgi:membrane protein required for colicin V production
MNVLDWICLGIILLLAIRCMVRGFVAEILSVAAYIVGAGAALLLYKQGAVLVHSRFAAVPLPQAISFAVIFVLGFLITRLLGHMLKQGVEAANLVTFDRVFGFLLGAFEGLVAVSLILLVMQVLGGVVDTSKILGTSFFAKTLLPVVGPEVAKALAPAGQTGKPELPKLKLPEPLKGAPLPVTKP